MTQDTLRFAANLSMLYTELPFMQRFAAAAKDGFKGVEFLFPYAFEAQEIAAQLKQHGLQQVLFNTPAGGADTAGMNAAWDAGMRGTASVVGCENEFQAGVLRALAYAQVLDCPRIHVMAGLLPEGVSADDARPAAQATYIANLHWAAAQAAKVGIDVVIEPINQRDVPRFFLNRQDHAHAIVQAVGAANLKVQMDLYHCQVVEGDVAMKLRQYLPTGRVGHIQVAGVPQRHEPDVGELNYPYLFSAIQEAGYGGWIGCEYRPARGAVTGGTSDGLGWLRRMATGDWA